MIIEIGLLAGELRLDKSFHCHLDREEITQFAH